MKRCLLLLLFVLGGYSLAYAQYQRSKSETIDFINNTLKLREDTRLYESEPVSKVNNLILLQHLNSETFKFKQVKQTADNKQLIVIVSKIHWDAFRAFGYNDNRSELYVYFNTKIMVGNSPGDVFSMYVPNDKVDEIKSAILHLAELIKTEK